MIQIKILEFARDGHSIENVLEKGKQILGRKLVQKGVDSMIKDLTVEATFTDGLKRIKISEPICSEYGDFELTFYGSFLPIPEKEIFTSNKAVNSDTNDVQMISNENIASTVTAYPGMIVPFKVNLNLDEGEISEISTTITGKIDSGHNNISLDNFIYLNREKGESVLLSVNNLSNQTIKV